MTSRYKVGDYIGELMIREVIRYADGSRGYSVGKTHFDEQTFFSEKEMKGWKS
jgi:hypothetical protein